MSLLLDPQFDDLRAFEFTPFQDRFVFRGFLPGESSRLWSSDGTSVGTRPVGDPIGTSAPTGVSNLRVWRNRVYFAAEGPGSSGRDPWVSDGTPSGTSLFVDLWPGPDSSSPADFVEVGGRLVFTAEAPSGRRQLASSDGTVAGTAFLGPIPGDVRNLTRITRGGALVRTITPAGRRRAWWTDGTTVVGPLPGFAIQSSQPNPQDHANDISDDAAVVRLELPAFGPELWRIDGTSAGTRLLFDQSLGDSAAGPAAVRLGDRVLYEGDDGTRGRELYWFALDLLEDEIAEPFGYGCPGTNGVTPTL